MDYSSIAGCQGSMPLDDEASLTLEYPSEFNPRVNQFGSWSWSTVSDRAVSASSEI